jgi:tRNA-(ms[2]io[6]A)-hydroxylase
VKRPDANDAEPTGYEEVYAALPLLHPTSRSWAELAAANLPEFLADHAVCEQQVAMYALSLAGYYPNDVELVERVAALAAEEVQHFRRVVAILKQRGWPLGGRRKNRWAQSLRERIVPGREPWTKVDRLLFGTLVEARSCERFTRLLEVVEDQEVALLLADLGPAERRHWELFYKLAGRGVEPDALAARFLGWREFEARLARGLGVSPAVHG